jgi:hypothetical protein
MTESITSIGHACAVLNRPYAIVQRAVTTLGIKPAVYINGVAHLADDDVERVRLHLDREAK